MASHPIHAHELDESTEESIDHGLRLGTTTALAAVVGVLAAGAAWALQALILLLTNALFFGRFSAAPCDSFDSHFPFIWVVTVPLLGSIVMGLMSKYLSPKIRGDGIPQVMESILIRDSLISPLVALLKPLSAAIVIGTGNPFGAEGPIIATGGALGSVLGQLCPVTAVERKALLAGGAAAGISAMFGSPVAGVILAIELLLFERRQRTLIPVAVASAVAFMVSRLYVAPGALFPMPDAPQASHAGPLAVCFFLGIPAGLAAMLITKSVTFFEDSFEKLPIHWMWWPSIGAVALAICAYFEPRVLGFGYTNIGHLIAGDFTVAACISLFFFKLVAWSISLGTGTSGGILAPVLTIGAALGAALGFGLDHLAPGISPGVPLCALAVMSGVFGATARAPIATVVFALELTHKPDGLPAVLACCAASQLVTIWLLPHSLMTEKIARSGLPIGHEYVHDELSLLRARDVMTREVLTIPASLSLAELTEWLAPGGIRTKHQGYPVVDEQGRLVGVLTKKDAAEAWAKPSHDGVKARDLCTREPVTAFPDEHLRYVADRVVSAGVGRLVVVERTSPGRIVGIVSRSDILEASVRARARVIKALEASNHEHGETRTSANEALPEAALVAGASAASRGTDGPIRLPMLGEKPANGTHGANGTNGTTVPVSAGAPTNHGA